MTPGSAVAGQTARPGTAGAIADALRPYQWVKNLLLLLPPIAAHQLDATTGRAIVLGVVSFSLVASGNYVFNDLLDRNADRAHPRKSTRPFASGRLSPAAGAALLGATWALGFALAGAFLPQPFLVTVAIYVLLTAAYSIRLKREPVLDVVMLAGLYVLRVVAGGAATGIRVSTWLLAFTLFVCLSVAFLKRFVEVHALAGPDPTPVPGRGYVTTDAAWLRAAGLAAAYLSVVVLAIYANSPDVTILYRHPERLLLLCPVLLYAGTRTWMFADRRQIHDDPVLAFVLDPATYAVGLIAAAIVWAAA